MARSFIHYSCQTIDDDDIAAVTQVLKSDWLTQGPAIVQFEEAVANYCHMPHAVAVASATAGLHITCLGLGIGSNDLVWTSPLSFVASANCARYCGAEVDFVDVDTNTGNISPAALTTKLETAASKGKLPKLVIAVHFAGRACDMTAIAELKAKYGFSLIEDAAHALGACYGDGTPIGSHPATDATIFSFHPVKPVTTGEGGVIVTRDAKLTERLRMLRTHGATRDPALLQQKDKPVWYFEQQYLGYHYRITDIQAALGVSQMKKLDKYINARRNLAKHYQELLSDLPLRLPLIDAFCGWHLYAVRLTQELSISSRNTLFNAMREKQIGVNVHYMPIHLHPYYQQLGFKKGQFPEAEAFFQQELSLPIHPRISVQDQEYIANTLRTLLAAA